ncbi:MAG: hypothetical protein AB1558_03755 [Thermodesulfobacteriota bacterium]
MARKKPESDSKTVLLIRDGPFDHEAMLSANVSVSSLQIRPAAPRKDILWFGRDWSYVMTYKTCH